MSTRGTNSTGSRAGADIQTPQRSLWERAPPGAHQAIVGWIRARILFSLAPWALVIGGRLHSDSSSLSPAGSPSPAGSRGRG